MPELIRIDVGGYEIESYPLPVVMQDGISCGLSDCDSFCSHLIHPTADLFHPARELSLNVRSQRRNATSPVVRKSLFEVLDSPFRRGLAFVEEAVYRRKAIVGACNQGDFLRTTKHLIEHPCW